MGAAAMTDLQEQDLPAQPLGPGAAAWYATGDLRAGVLSIRTLVLQVAHPMVGAGVGEHSVYKTDPYGRLWRTVESLLRQVYGGHRAAEEGRKLLAMHRDIKGVDASGRRYHALDPEAYLWVHATMFDNWRIFLRDLGPGLTPAQERQLFDEWRRMGLLIGVRPRVLPGTVDEFDAYWQTMLTRLENNPVVQDLLFNGPGPPPYTPVPQWLMRALNAPLLQLQRSIVETLDPVLAERFGLPRTARSARQTRLLLRLSRALGHLPWAVRVGLPARLAMRRTRRDPRTRPEAVPYP
jgi:uncharacterized protein (DUF2236 family)